MIAHVCNINEKKIEFAIDDSKTKHNTFFPGKKLKFMIGIDLKSQVARTF